MGQKRMSKWFCMLIAVYPILSRYASFIPFITLSETLLIVFLLFAMLDGIKLNKSVKGMWPFCLYLVLHIVFALLGKNKGDTFDAVGTTGRLLFLYLSMFFLIGKYYEQKLELKYVRMIGIALSIYAWLQIIFSFFGIYLTTYIPFLKIMGNVNIDVAVQKNAFYGYSFRPRSLLNEPAALCSYLLLVLAVILFSNEKMKHWVFEAFLVTSVCFASRSSTGIIVASIIWFLYIFQKKRLTPNKRNNFLISAAVVMIIACIAIWVSGIWQYFVMRTFGGSISFAGLSKSTRFYAIQNMFDASETIFGILFGAGLAEMGVYLPGFARAYYSFGLIGLAVIFIHFISVYRYGDELQRKILVIYVILNLGTEILFGNFALIYLPIILSTNNRRLKIKKELMYLNLPVDKNKQRG